MVSDAGGLMWSQTGTHTWRGAGKTVQPVPRLLGKTARGKVSNAIETYLNDNRLMERSQICLRFTCGLAPMRN